MTSEEIIRLKSLGWTYKQIGVKFNVNTKKAYELYLDACNNLGIEPIKSGRGRKIDQKRIEKMKELKDRGMTLEQIGVMFHVSKQRVHQIIGGK